VVSNENLDYNVDKLRYLAFDKYIVVNGTVITKDHKDFNKFKLDAPLSSSNHYLQINAE
jgi:hypothetical protein